MPDHDIYSQDMLIEGVLAVMRPRHACQLTSVQEWWVPTVIESQVAESRQGDLFAPAPPRESTRITSSMTRMPCGKDTCHDPLVLQTLGLASVIGDLRMGRLERVQSWETSAVEAVMGPVAVGTPDALALDVAPSDPVPVDRPIEFTFP